MRFWRASILFSHKLRRPRRQHLKANKSLKAAKTEKFEPPAVFDFNYETSEKAIIVDPKVNISLCVLGGNIKVNGWDRNEVRVFINEGSPVGFKVLQKNRQTEKPVWIMVIAYDEKKNAGVSEECISGDNIEIDAPRNTTVNIKSQESRTVIDSIGKVSIKNVVGDIMLNNIAGGIEAVTYEGDVVVEKSSGAMSLQSITGNISVSGVSPSEIGDVFQSENQQRCDFTSINGTSPDGNKYEFRFDQIYGRTFYQRSIFIRNSKRFDSIIYSDRFILQNLRRLWLRHV